MIRLTRRNHEAIIINLSTIAYVEATPDTLITLTNGERIHVRETVDDVVARAVAYQERVQRGSIQILGEISGQASGQEGAPPIGETR